MNDREKIQKAFNQCSDALMSLDQKSILKVFHLLTVQFDISPAVVINQPNENAQKDTSHKVTYLPSGEDFDGYGNGNDNTNKVSKKGSSKKGKSGSSNSLTYLSDFDFMPPNNESLKDFHGKYKATSNMEFNLIFIYYLQEILREKEISMNHIYSCYRHLNLKIPSFPQTLADTKTRKGWITANTNDLIVTREGLNYLQHKMTKNDVEQS